MDAPLMARSKELDKKTGLNEMDAGEPGRARFFAGELAGSKIEAYHRLER